LIKSFCILFALSILWLQASAQGVFRKTFYDSDRKVLKEEFYVNDTLANQLDGSYASYFLSGQKKSEGFYAHNRPIDDWVYYFENGSIRQSGYFFRGKTIGVWTNYYENGNKRSEGILSDQMKVGEWAYFYEDGGTKSSGEYLQNLREGAWRYFYEDGEKKAQGFFKEGVGIYSEYFVSGNLKMEGLNRHGKSDSLWVYYFESGEKLAEGYFKNGFKTGPWKYFFKNGQISAEGGFENGMTLGNWIYYYYDGAKSAEGLQKDDLKDGYWKMFYQTGETRGIGEFDEGKGEYTEYYPSGQVKVKGAFIDDLNHGHWVYYDQDGNIDGEAFFKNGIGDYEGFYQSGDKKMSGKISKGRRVGEWTLYKKNGEIAGKYHPIYEDESPVFRTSEILEDPEEAQDYDKPEYRYKSKSLRYFTPVINEYRGVILSTNPLFTLAGFLPISLEYYRQERQGVELTYNMLRSPFYISDDNIDLNDSYIRGFSFQLKQKFYSPDQKLGMFYFGHFLGVDIRNHYTNINEGSPPIDTRISATENRLYYGLMIGDRWMKDPGDAGFTIDVFLGIGIGKRSYSANYSDASYDSYFSDLNQNKTVVPVIFGINIGYLGIRKSKNQPVPIRK